MLAKVSRCIMAKLPRRSANLMAVCVVGSPKLHPGSREALAFLSESSNRVIITGRYLRRRSDSVGSEAKRYSYVHRVSAIFWERFGERTNETRPVITYEEGSSFIPSYKCISES